MSEQCRSLTLLASRCAKFLTLIGDRQIPDSAQNERTYWRSPERFVVDEEDEWTPVANRLARFHLCSVELELQVAAIYITETRNDGRPIIIRPVLSDLLNPGIDDGFGTEHDGILRAHVVGKVDSELGLASTHAQE